jgi:hypothetical protein
MLGKKQHKYYDDRELWDDIVLLLKEKKFYAEKKRDVDGYSQLACSNCDTTVYIHYL